MDLGDGREIERTYCYSIALELRRKLLLADYL
jgi:hypothetical protein